MAEKKTKIYTKKGDDGFTSLVGGQRVHKSEQMIEKYGEVDELNSHIGLLLFYMSDNEKLKICITCLKNIQNRLFDLGSNLASRSEDRSRFKLPQMNDKMIKSIESEIDRLDNDLAPLKNFILPGGNLAAAQAHICRTVCRRVERVILRGDSTLLPPFSLEFINRLSDYLFVLARYLNHIENINEELWEL